MNGLTREQIIEIRDWIVEGNALGPGDTQETRCVKEAFQLLLSKVEQVDLIKEHSVL